MTLNFALIGAAGYIAPRHMTAIKDTANQLVAATDPRDSVGVLDRYFLDTKFFSEIERFDRHLEKLRRGPEEDRVRFVTICSPNYLHDAHIRLALRIGADAICEKPLVINPWNLDALQVFEEEMGRRIYTVLQLRVHPELLKLREELQAQPKNRKREVVLTYVAARGGWYHGSWKGSEDRSGGLGTNIGIHFFDLLIWLFGSPKRCFVHLYGPKRMAGFLELQEADVRWFLSVDSTDLPFSAQPGVKTTFRSITVDGKELEFSDGFGDLHTLVYKNTLAGSGFGIEQSRPSIELVYRIRTSKVEGRPDYLHPMLAGGRK